MDWQHRFDGFQLDDYGVFNKQIDVISRIQELSLVVDRDPLVRDDSQATYPQLSNKAFVVNVFEQARTQMTIDFNRGLDDAEGDAVESFAFHVTPRLPKVQPRNQRIC